MINYVPRHFLQCPNVQINVVILSIYFIFRYWNVISELVVIYNGKQKVLAKGRLFCGGINVILNMIFLERFGIIAAAFTTILSELILCIILNYENKIKI